MKLPNHPYAFIDGSFNPKTRVYGCGGFLVDPEKNIEWMIQDVGDDPSWVSMRNVAGEILGAMTVAQLALQRGFEKLTIFHDYIGIELWVTGEWTARKPQTKEYVRVMNQVQKSGLTLYFQHVYGHSGIEGNELADFYARQVVGLA